MAIAPIKGLFETHLTVSNLERSIAFYSNIVGLTLAHRVPERHVAFFWIGRPGQSMLGLWSYHSSPMRMSLHLALTVDVADVLSAVGRLRDVGVTPLDGLGRPASEPDVIGWMPALSVFFEDPNGHMLELIAMLDEPARREEGFVPLTKWRAQSAPSSMS
jgi:catechol 2,3-dioxygenase-like lactoylglutathione lyase family enzyme